MASIFDRPKIHSTALCTGDGGGGVGVVNHNAACFEVVGVQLSCTQKSQNDACAYIQQGRSRLRCKMKMQGHGCFEKKRVMQHSVTSATAPKQLAFGRLLRSHGRWLAWELGPILGYYLCGSL